MKAYNRFSGVVFFICILYISSTQCASGAQHIEVVDETRSRQNQNSHRTVHIEVDITSERDLQHEVDKGHQPWRLDPISVAHATLVERTDDKIAYDRCRLAYEHDGESLVVCNGGKKYLVLLKRLVRPNGIWTAVEYRKEHLDGTWKTPFTLGK